MISDLAMVATLMQHVAIHQCANILADSMSLGTVNSSRAPATENALSPTLYQGTMVQQACCFKRRIDSSRLFNPNPPSLALAIPLHIIILTL